MFRFWISNSRGTFPRVLRHWGPRVSEGPEVLWFLGVHGILRYWGSQRSWGFQGSQGSRGPRSEFHFSTMPYKIVKPLIFIHLAHLAQLNFLSEIIIKSALKLQASVMYAAIYCLSPIKDNVWNKILKEIELESQTPYLK